MVALSSILPKQGRIIHTNFDGHDVSHYKRPSIGQVSEFLENGIYLRLGLFKDILSDPNAVKLISAVREKGEIVAYTMLCDDIPYVGRASYRGYTCYGVIGVYTKREHRGKGYARASMKHMASYLNRKVGRENNGAVWAQSHIHPSFQKVFEAISPGISAISFGYAYDIEREEMKMAA